MANQRKPDEVVGGRILSGRPLAERRSKLKLLYGITVEEYNSMWEAQGGKCAICGDDGTLDTDHSHETGKVRALLCRRCNLVVGLLEKGAVTQALEYLRAHNA